MEASTPPGRAQKHEGTIRPPSCKPLDSHSKDIPGREVHAPSSLHFELPPRRPSLRVSNGSRTPQHTYRQEKERTQQRKNAVNCNSQKPERQGEQPDDRIKHQRQQSQRPAQDE